MAKNNCEDTFRVVRSPESQKMEAFMHFPVDLIDDHTPIPTTFIDMFINNELSKDEFSVLFNICRRTFGELKEKCFIESPEKLGMDHERLRVAVKKLEDNELISSYHKEGEPSMFSLYFEDKEEAREAFDSFRDYWEPSL